jgi:hypothetical protein
VIVTGVANVTTVGFVAEPVMAYTLPLSQTLSATGAGVGVAEGYGVGVGSLAQIVQPLIGTIKTTINMARIDILAIVFIEITPVMLNKKFDTGHDKHIVLLMLPKTNISLNELVKR